MLVVCGGGGRTSNELINDEVGQTASMATGGILSGASGDAPSRQTGGRGAGCLRGLGGCGLGALSWLLVVCGGGRVWGGVLALAGEGRRRG